MSTGLGQSRRAPASSLRRGLGAGLAVGGHRLGLGNCVATGAAIGAITANGLSGRSDHRSDVQLETDCGRCSAAVTAQQIGSATRATGCLCRALHDVADVIYETGGEIGGGRPAHAATAPAVRRATGATDGMLAHDRCAPGCNRKGCAQECAAAAGAAIGTIQARTACAAGQDGCRRRCRRIRRRWCDVY